MGIPEYMTGGPRRILLYNVTVVRFTAQARTHTPAVAAAVAAAAACCLCLVPVCAAAWQQLAAAARLPVQKLQNARVVHEKVVCDGVSRVAVVGCLFVAVVLELRSNNDNKYNAL